MNLKPTPPQRPYMIVPRQTLLTKTEVSRTQIYDGDEITLAPGARYFLDKEYDRDNGSEDFVVEFTEDERPNPNYDKELAEFNRQTAIYEAEVAAYPAKVTAWEVGERDRKLAQYKTLQKELGL